MPWVVVADLEGSSICVMEDRAACRDTGPIAALPPSSADPERDARFWAALSGWVLAAGHGAVTLRHPSGRGPLPWTVLADPSGNELCLLPAGGGGGAV